MMVLVDTPVWSLALRRKPADVNPDERKLTYALANLIQDGRAQIAGPIRQELLSGIREPERFRKLRDQLRAFPEPAVQAEDYEEAASMQNRCRAKGIAGSAIDFLICAIAHRRGWHILTSDDDFPRCARTIPVNLYQPS
jgi:predicted nucleic acid-binding protein